MGRLIRWCSGCFDEIELVYEKAEANPDIGSLLRELEELALKEAEDNCSLLTVGGEPLTRESFLQMSEADKEKVICVLGNAGLVEFQPSMTEPTITVTFAPFIPKVQGCTIFTLLNRIEKMDGAYNVLFEKASLHVQTPLGGKKGLFKWYMLIMRLYPWLSVQESSTNQIAVQ